jgi:hypothetical protein
MTDQRPGVLVVFVEVDESDAEELDRWYREEHGPEKLATPGYTGLRRFRAYDGSACYLAIYDLADVEAAMKPGNASPESAGQMRQIMAKWKDWKRSVWVEIEAVQGPEQQPPH